ncbi:MAG: PDZ domain-containing protein, partial [Candidatus Brocadia sp.]
MPNKILYLVFFNLCVLAITTVHTDTLAVEGMQVSVEGQHFDPNNFFAFEGTGFKKDVVDFNKGWLGIFMEDVEGKGVLVKEITQGSPAAEAGLKAGDIITRINNETPIGRNERNLIQFK